MEKTGKVRVCCMLTGLLYAMKGEIESLLPEGADIGSRLLYQDFAWTLL